MEQHLREHFERATEGDTGVAPAELARAAIVEGVGLRRRRRQLITSGVAAVVVVLIGTATGLHLAVGSPSGTPELVAAAMAPVTAPSCQRRPVEHDATDAVVFLTPDATDRQREALRTALRDDPRIAALVYESREQAYQKFRTRWAQDPDLVAAVDAGQLPESFRLRLLAASQYTAVRSRYARTAGVELVIGRRCAADAPVGGTL